MIAAFIFVFILATSGVRAGEVDLSEIIVDPEELGNLGLPPPSYSYDDFNDWETWEASPEIVSMLPYSRSGYDYDGLVVYIIDYGKWRFRDVAHLTEEQRREFWKYFEQLHRRLARDAALCNDQKMVFLTDWDGFTLRDYASGSALRESLQMFASFGRLNTYIKYGFFVNVNFAAETFVNIARPFLGNLLEYIDVYGTKEEKWKPRILKSIPADQLPPKFGGAEGWKPLPLN